MGIILNPFVSFPDSGDIEIFYDTYVNWADPNKPDGHFQGFDGYDANNYVEENANGMRLVSDASIKTELYTNNKILLAGNSYRVTIDVYSVALADPAVKVRDAAFLTVSTVGIHSFEFTETTDSRLGITNDGNKSYDMVFRSILVEQIPDL